MKNIFDYI